MASSHSQPDLSLEVVANDRSGVALAWPFIRYDDPVAGMNVLAGTTPLLLIPLESGIHEFIDRLLAFINGGGWDLIDAETPQRAKAQLLRLGKQSGAFTSERALYKGARVFHLYLYSDHLKLTPTDNSRNHAAGLESLRGNAEIKIPRDGSLRERLIEAIPVILGRCRISVPIK